MVAREIKKEAKRFVDKAIEKSFMVNTDGSPGLINLKKVDVDYQVVDLNKEILDHPTSAFRKLRESGKEQKS